MKAEEFIRRLQEYYGKQYNQVQLEVLKDWSKKLSGRSLAATYDVITLRYDGRFQLPLKKDLDEALTEALDSIPALVYPAPKKELKQIADDAGITAEELEENLARLRRVVSGAIKKVGGDK